MVLEHLWTYLAPRKKKCMLMNFNVAMIAQIAAFWGIMMSFSPSFLCHFWESKFSVMQDSTCKRYTIWSYQTESRKKKNFLLSVAHIKIHPQGGHLNSDIINSAEGHQITKDNLKTRNLREMSCVKWRRARSWLIKHGPLEVWHNCIITRQM